MIIVFSMYMALFILYFIGFSLPTILVCIKTKKYFKGKGSFKLAFLLNFTTIFLNIFIVWYFIILDKTAFFIEFFDAVGNGYYESFEYSSIRQSCLGFFLLMILNFKLLINFITLYKEKKDDKDYKKIFKFCILFLVFLVFLFSGCILGKKIKAVRNRINITDDNIYSYQDFYDQLINRRLLNKNYYYDIYAIDSSGKYGFSNSNTEGYRININDDRRFPLLVYDEYSSKLKSNSSNDEVHWYIYYVDGQIYAVTEYNDGIVVSEDKDIIVYNFRKNCYVKGGGIICTTCGTPQLSGFPYIREVYDSKCIEIKVVDRVDGKTLDKIATEISSQH